jgi:hypothetical protein
MVLTWSAACVITGVVAVPSVLSASPAAASPAHVPLVAGQAALSQLQLGHVTPLSTARPVPASWPRPGNPLAVGSAGGQAYLSKPLKSTNWSGYIDTGKGADFSQVAGSWTVPAVQPGPSGFSSSWIGIDGANNEFLIQAGTEQDWSPDGVVYYAWYELIPALSMYLGAVYPGDHMTTDIVKEGASAWDITVADTTRHQVWSGAVSYTTPGASAEWIEEAPTNAMTTKLFPLANYGSVQFTGLGVSGAGTSSATLKPVYMVARKHGPVKSYPSQYDSTTDSFGVAYGTPATSNGFPGVPIAPAATTSTTTPSTTTTTSVTPSPPSTPGYWLTGLDGGVFGFGSAGFHGSTTGLGTGKGLTEITGIAGTPDGNGYWLVTAEGGVFPFGDAQYYGSLVSLNALELPIIGIRATADGRGYYMVGVDGGVYAFGDARFEGACGTIGGCGVDAVTAMTPDATGDGYWLLVANCDMVAFGDAAPFSNYECETHAVAAKEIARTVALTPDGQGYWALLESETGASIYPVGDAAKYGDWYKSVIPVQGDLPVALLVTRDGGGAWVVLASGTVEDLGDAPPIGSLTGTKLHAIIFSAANS